MLSAIEKQIKFCDNMDNAHVFVCPHCQESTNKLLSQKKCQHCDGELHHKLTMYGEYITTKK